MSITCLPFALARHSSSASYDHQLAKAALQYLKNHVKGIDVNGKKYKPLTVSVTEGGK